LGLTDLKKGGICKLGKIAEPDLGMRLPSAIPGGLTDPSWNGLSKPCGLTDPNLGLTDLKKGGICKLGKIAEPDLGMRLPSAIPGGLTDPSWNGLSKPWRAY
jgi:hypothetical protein